MKIKTTITFVREVNPDDYESTAPTLMTAEDIATDPPAFFEEAYEVGFTQTSEEVRQ